MNKLTLLILTIILSSCSTMYIPSAPNIPLLSKEHESNISLGTGTNSVSLSGAHAVNSKYAVILNSAVSYGNFTSFNDLGDLYYNGGDEYLFEGGYFQHYIVETGFGRYFSFNDGILELYSGTGYGHAKSGSYRNDYGSVFVQMNNGFKWANFEVGTSLKLVGSYMNYEYPYSEASFPVIVRNEYIPVASLQLGGIIRTGGDHIKFFISPGVHFSKAYTTTEKQDLGIGFSGPNGNTFYTLLNFSMGLNFRF